jgi:hypothetical protein
MNRARRRRRRGRIVAVRTGRNRALVIAETPRGQPARFAFVDVEPGPLRSPPRISPATAAWVRNQGEVYVPTLEHEPRSAIPGGHAR